MLGSFKLKYALEIFDFVMFFCVFFFWFSSYGNLNHVCIVDLIIFFYGKPSSSWLFKCKILYMAMKEFIRELKGVYGY